MLSVSRSIQMPIKYICDQEGCSNEQGTRDARLPPGWSCDPVHEGGKYMRWMTYVCPECMEKRDMARAAAKQMSCDEQQVAK